MLDAGSGCENHALRDAFLRSERLVGVLFSACRGGVWSNRRSRRIYLVATQRRRLFILEELS